MPRNTGELYYGEPVDDDQILPVFTGGSNGSAETRPAVEQAPAAIDPDILRSIANALVVASASALAIAAPGRAQTITGGTPQLLYRNDGSEAVLL